MGAVYVGIRHDDDLVIAKLCDIELVMNACSERRDHGLDLFVGVDSVFSCLLDVQYFAAKGKNGLCRAASGRLGAASCRIALDQEDFTFLGIFVGAVRKLARKRSCLQNPFSFRDLSRLSCRFSGSLRGKGILQDFSRNGRILLQIVSQLLGDDAVRGSSRLHVAELLLSLSFKLGILNLDADDCGDSLSDIISGEVLVIVLENLVPSSVIVEGLSERISEAHQMHAAFRCVDVIYKTVFAVVVGIVVLESDFHIYIVLHPFKIGDFRINRRLSAV